MDLTIAHMKRSRTQFLHRLGEIGQCDVDKLKGCSHQQLFARRDWAVLPVLPEQ